MRGLLSTLLLAGSGHAECTGDESFDDATPSCSPTEFKLEVNKCAFENARFNNPENAYLAGPDFVDMPEIDVNATNQCVPVLDGDNYVFTITENIEDCGTSVNNNGTHVTYENAVQSTIGTDNAIISRKRNMKINFSCFFELEMTLSVADAIKPRIQHFEVQTSNFAYDFLQPISIGRCGHHRRCFLRLDGLVRDRLLRHPGDWQLHHSGARKASCRRLD